MSDAVFSATPAPARPEADQRVAYSLGQILGADEFEQEQYYFLERDRQHNRVLHGYGTAHGLAVSLAGSEVRVEKGLALTPAGRVVRVDARQCADFAAWLGEHRGELGAPDAAGLSSAWVVLAYHECFTRREPLPATPCCGEGEGVPTRIAETFHVAFAAAPPPMPEEVATDRFGRLLRAIRLAPSPGTALTAAGVPDLVRSLVAGEAAGGPWAVAPAALDAVFETAFRVWITEVRPQMPFSGDPPESDVPLLLAALRFQLGAGGLVAGTLAVDESPRPLLLPTRSLHELRQAAVLALPQPAATVVAEQAFDQASAPGVATEYARADHTHGTPALPAAGGDLSGTLADAVVAFLQGEPLVATGAGDGQLLGYQSGTGWVPVDPPAGGSDAMAPPGDSVVAERVFGLTETAGSALAYARADHSHGTPPLPAAGGDLSGSLGGAEVVGLRGLPLAKEAPDHGDALVWDAKAKAWRPYQGVHVVAAGIVDMRGPRGPVFGGLRVVDAAPLTIAFAGYRMPDFERGAMYVLKALALADPREPALTVGFGGFTEKGMVIALSRDGQAIGLDGEMAVMVEVSAFLPTRERESPIDPLEPFERIGRALPGTRKGGRT